MNKSKLKRIMAILLSIMAIVSMVGCSNGKSESLSSQVFKEMKTTDIDGNKVDSSIFSKNKLTLVNLWNTGCTPCIDEIPVLDKLNKEYEKKGVSIKGLLLGIGAGLTEEEKSEAQGILNKSKSSYQQLITSNEMLEDDLFKNLDVFPATLFVDKDGNIVERIDGSSDYEGWKARIESVLKKVDANE
ncbi:TlpA family protein disulfide reductase [Intestinibacter sp.]